MSRLFPGVSFRSLDSFDLSNVYIGSIRSSTSLYGQSSSRYSCSLWSWGQHLIGLLLGLGMTTRCLQDRYLSTIFHHFGRLFGPFGCCGAWRRPSLLYQAYECFLIPSRDKISAELLTYRNSGTLFVSNSFFDLKLPLHYSPIPRRNFAYIWNHDESFFLILDYFDFSISLDESNREVVMAQQRK